MPEISKITLPSGTTYDIKDATARAQIGGAIVLRGTTTTALTDGATTNPITINGDSYTAVANDAVFYGNKEFVFDGTNWHEFGDMSGLGALATKDNATGSFTPSGSVSVSVDQAGATDTVTEVTNVGSMPTYTVSNEVLTITAGAVPTTNNVTVKTGDASYTGAFTGTAGTVTVS